MEHDYRTFRRNTNATNYTHFSIICFVVACQQRIESLHPKLLSLIISHIFLFAIINKTFFKKLYIILLLILILILKSDFFFRIRLIFSASLYMFYKFWIILYCNLYLLMDLWIRNSKQFLNVLTECAIISVWFFFDIYKILLYYDLFPSNRIFLFYS